jgi:dipeptidyl aminopeptidase/acylaminoacyl peptidase
VPEPFVTTEDLFRIAAVSDPQFSPDGCWIAYVQTEMDREENCYKSAIRLVPSSGGPARRFTNGEKRDTAPRWSPDGRWLAFVSTGGEEKAKAQIYLIPTDGGEAHRLTEMENGASEPAWWSSGDGGAAHLAFVSRVNAEEMAAEDEPGAETPLDADERKRQESKKEKKEKEKADPRVEVEMVRYPRDGHELSRSGEPKHRLDRLERIVGWFNRHVKDRVGAAGLEE